MLSGSGSSTAGTTCKVCDAQCAVPPHSGSLRQAEGLMHAPDTDAAAGAGDDEENWSRGLKAKQWWVWRERLMVMAAQQPGAG